MSVDLSELEEKLVEGGEAGDFEEAEGIAKEMGEQKASKGLLTSGGGIIASMAAYLTSGAGALITGSPSPYLFIMGAGALGVGGSLLGIIHYGEKHPKGYLKVDEALYEGEEATVPEVVRNYQERK